MGIFLGSLSVKRDAEKIPVLMAVNGVFHPAFNFLKTRELEDHVAYLKLLEGMLDEKSIAEAEKAKDLVSASDHALLDKAAKTRLEEAFKHMKCLLEAVNR